MSHKFKSYFHVVLLDFKKDSKESSETYVTNLEKKVEEQEWRNATHS